MSYSKEEKAAYMRKWYEAHKEEQRAAARIRGAKRRKTHPEYMTTYRAKYPEKFKATTRAAGYKRNYGITVEQYEEMLLAQGGGCAICGTNSNFGQRLHVDHDHQTGKVRGILCSMCNRGLGCFYDNIDNLLKLVEYLRKNSNV